MTGAAVATIATFVPTNLERVTDLAELAALVDTERASYLALGIDTISADEGRSSTDLAVAAAKEALTASGVTPDEVGGLVLVESRVPQTFMTSEATRVQEAIGAERAQTFSVGGLGCVSITPGLVAAAGLLATDASVEHVLVAHGSKPPTPRRYRHPVTISGDGGIAVIVARDGPIRVVDVALETNGRYSDLFGVDFRDRPVADWIEACTDVPTYSFRLAIESRNRFAAMNERVLARHGLTLGDVDHFVMQNLSEGSFAFYEQAFGITFAAACRRNLRRYGHLGPVDVLLNVQSALDAGEFAAGERVLVMNASPVAAWSTWLIELDGGAAAGAYLL